MSTVYQAYLEKVAYGWGDLKQDLKTLGRAAKGVGKELPTSLDEAVENAKWAVQEAKRPVVRNLRPVVRNLRKADRAVLGSFVDTLEDLPILDEARLAKARFHKELGDRKSSLSGKLESYGAGAKDILKVMDNNAVPWLRNLKKNWRKEFPSDDAPAKKRPGRSSRRPVKQKDRRAAFKKGPSGELKNPYS